MQDIELYTKVLGISPPWKVSNANLDAAQQIAEILVTYDGPEACPVCGETARKYDTRSRRWQHVDFNEYQLFITAEIPRIECPTHGIKPIPEEWSGLTWYPRTI